MLVSVIFGFDQVVYGIVTYMSFGIRSCPIILQHVFASEKLCSTDKVSVTGRLPVTLFMIYPRNAVDILVLMQQVVATV